MSDFSNQLCLDVPLLEDEGVCEDMDLQQDDASNEDSSDEEVSDDEDDDMEESDDQSGEQSLPTRTKQT